MDRIYKESGIEWIGKIPDTWEIKRLKEIFVERNNRDAKGKTLLSVSQYYGIKPKAETDIADSHVAESYDDYKVVFSGDFVMNIMLAWNGSYAVSDYEGIVSPAYCVYQFRKNSCHKFFHYLLRIDGYQTAFKTMSRGIIDSRLRLYPEQFYTFNTIFPPLQEQQHIADYLDEKCGEIDSLIGLQEQMIEKLKAYKQSVITEAVTKGLDPKAKLVPSCIDWIGEIPEGVKLVKLSILTSKIGSGSTPRGGSTIYVKEGIKFLRSQNVYCEGFDLSDVAYITEEIDEEMNGTRVQIGDVLLNITGASIGRCYYVDDTLGRANVNQHVSIIRPTKIQTKYLKYYLQSNCGQIQIALLQTGGNREGLSAAALSQFLIVYPSQDEQRSIASYLDEKCADIDRLISMKQQKIESLKDYKKSVIYEAVTGKTIIE